MVEVIVAVMVVSIIMAMFAKVTGASAQMYLRSLEIIRETENFNSEYYKTTNISGRTSVTKNMTLKEKDGTAEISLKKGELQKFQDTGTGIVRYSIKVDQTGSSGPET